MQIRPNPQSLLRCACLLFLVAAGAALARAQEPSPDPEVDRLTTLAEQGNASAQLKLGMHYYDGVGRREPPDYAEALKWFRRAADQGNAEAQDRVGMMYRAGRGVSRDDAEAARWYLLAANAGNDHAQRQLIEMYQWGIGVPRDLQESRKWLKVQKARHPDKSATAAWVLFIAGALVLLAFSLGLAALQRNSLTGWQHFAVAIFIHLGGIALVLNTLVTYGFGIAFPHCAHSFLATSCSQIGDPQTRKIVNAIGDRSTVNLIFRFMAGVGLALDALAIWYLVYLCRLPFRRTPRAARLGGIPNGQTGRGLAAGR